MATLQDAIDEYNRKQDELWDAAQRCAANGDSEGFIRLTAEAFFMEHPATAIFRRCKGGPFKGGDSMRIPVMYGPS